MTAETTTEGGGMKASFKVMDDGVTAYDSNGNVFVLAGSKWVLYSKVSRRTLEQLKLV